MTPAPPLGASPPQLTPGTFRSGTLSKALCVPKGWAVWGAWEAVTRRHRCSLKHSARVGVIREGGRLCLKASARVAADGSPRACATSSLWDMGPTHRALGEQQVEGPSHLTPPAPYACSGTTGRPRWVGSAAGPPLPETDKTSFSGLPEPHTEWGVEEAVTLLSQVGLWYLLRPQASWFLMQGAQSTVLSSL